MAFFGRFFDKLEHARRRETFARARRAKAERRAFMDSMMMGGGGAASGGYQIPYAALFDGTDDLTRTFGQDDGDTWALSFWDAQVSPTPTGNEYFFSDTSGGFAYLTSGAIRAYNGATSDDSAALFRDPTGPKHHLISCNAGTVTYKINGVTVEGLTPPTFSTINSAVTHYIGSLYGNNFANIVLAHVAFCSTTAYDTDDFVDFDDNTQPTPKDLSGLTWGNNGFWLKFEEDNGGTPSLGNDLGKDSSGNGNHWTMPTAGVTQVTNTPTNWVATLNPLEATRGGTRADFSNGNTNLSNTAGSWKTGFGAALPKSGIWAWEFEVTRSTGTARFQIGLVKAASFSATNLNNADAIWLYDDGSGTYYNGTTSSGTTAGFTTERVMHYFDADNGKWGIKINGTDYGYVLTGLDTSEVWLIGAAIYNQDVQFYFDDADFTHSLPTNAKALKSSNLPAVTGKLSDIFVNETDTESNIESTLDAALSGGVYMDWLANRDSAENQLWRFSHDASNEHAFGTNTASTYQTKSTLSGSDNWVGNRVKHDPSNGIFIGSVSHTNGSDANISLSIGTTRYVVWLFPRNGGDVWFWHPDLTSGYLVKLNHYNAAVSSSSIKNFTSTGFDIDTAMATGDYDYCVVAESPFFFIGKGKGTGTTPGPFITANMLPHWVFGKSEPTNGKWFSLTRAQSPANVNDKPLAFNHNSTETYFTADAKGDFCTTGFNVYAGAFTDMNSSAATNIIWCMFGVPLAHLPKSPPS